MSCRRLEIRDLTIELAGGTRTLVDTLNLDLDGGASLAVVGESGAGKSMTALAIMNLLPRGVHQVSGSIRINHRDLGRLERREMQLVRNQEIAMIMQNPTSAFDPVFTIYSHFKETIAVGGSRIGAAAVRRIALEALEEVALPDAAAILDAYPFQLSGGMLQRVMIALALVNDPQYLIADEPTTDLDVLSQKKVLDLIKERCSARHLGLLLITHDLSVAAYMTDSIAIMHRGKVVESGATRDILGTPRHAYACELVNAHNQLYCQRFDSMVRAGGVTVGGVRRGCD